MAQAGLAAHKKGARRSGRAIVFIDETGHTFLAPLGTTWAPVGQPPILRRVSQRRELSSIVALVAPVGRPARLYARHFRGSIRGAQVIVALHHFRRRVGPLLVLWDRLQAHRATAVQAFLAAHPADYQCEWLPPYAPDLNPEELCNGAIKQELLDAAPASVDELHHVVRRGFLRLGRQPAVLHRFFQHAGLAVNQLL